jgi:ribosome biogenesis GTPase
MPERKRPDPRREDRRPVRNPETHPLEGLVVASHGRHYDVELADSRRLSCVTRGKKGGVVCGDRVEIETTGPDQGVIRSIAPRESLLYRSDPFREKTIAANVTQIVVVVAPVPSFYEDLIGRCLVAAETAGLRVLIVLNKCDLVEEAARAMEILGLYRELGYAVLPLSAKRDLGPLLPYLHGQTSVLVGQSGMGKSTLINALLPGTQARTQEVSEALDSGRHTTTHATLYHLDRDSHIIDSPGLQDFGLHHLKLDEIGAAFVEFRPYLGQCRFNNCIHLNEPGCAVLHAAARGEIAPRRLSFYHNLVNELQNVKKRY